MGTAYIHSQFGHICTNCIGNGYSLINIVLNLCIVFVVEHGKVVFEIKIPFSCTRFDSVQMGFIQGVKRPII